MLNDTIASISTALKDGAISIVRMSGDDSFSIIRKISDVKDIKANTIVYSHIRNIGEIIDEVLISFFEKGRSYTCEDMVEINCHGGVYVTRAILNLLLENGCRLAEPGEFTKRAYLNGRIDLSEADAVNDLIKAQSKIQARSAIRGLDGSIERLLNPLMDQMKDVISMIEVNIDYPEYEDELQMSNEIIKPHVIKWIKQAEEMIDKAERFSLVKDGLDTVIIGKPNVGKSSIINKLLGENRVIVSDIAGTTRDAIDTSLKYDGKEYIFIDTAGLRRKAKIKEDIEKFSMVRTVAAVERADICVVVISAEEGVTEQDAKIAGIAHDSGKGIIVAVNKWDAIEKTDKSVYEHERKIREVLSFMPYAQVIFISAKTGQRIGKLFECIEQVIQNQNLRIKTGVLNEILTEAVAMQQPPSDKGRRLKIFYMTQVSVKPPTFVIFVNDKELMHFSYTRYIENKIREAFGFEGTSLKFIIRERNEKD